MSTKTRFRVSIRYLAALFAAAVFCAAAVGYAAGARTAPRLVLESCGEGYEKDGR